MARLNNRIRQVRKSRGLTQTQLATLVGSTAATISRLETTDMTLSTRWVERLGVALDILPGDLLVTPSHVIHIPTLGEFDVMGILESGTLPPQQLAPVQLLFENTLGASLSADIGPYKANDFVVARLVPYEQLALLLGKDCLFRDPSGIIHLRKLIAVEENMLTLEDIGAQGSLFHFDRFEWVAVLVFSIRRANDE
ncbi:MAG: helix-turn-helix domain-containing protein [Parvibaculaceae bacterium]|nr:helix-turn-helix domain-containing protein [Parvibaculaceae bacterium]